MLRSESQQDGFNFWRLPQLKEGELHHSVDVSQWGELFKVLWAVRVENSPFMCIYGKRASSCANAKRRKSTKQICYCDYLTASLMWGPGSPDPPLKYCLYQKGAFKANNKGSESPVWRLAEGSASHFTFENSNECFVRFPSSLSSLRCFISSVCRESSAAVL